MQGRAPWAEEARAVLEGITSTEGRVAVTVVLVGAALVVGWALLPRFVATVDRAVTRRFDVGPLAALVELVGRYTPATMGGVLLGLVRLSLVAGTVLAVLVLWGLGPFLRRGATFAYDAIPPSAVPVVGKALVSVVIAFFAYVAAAAAGDAVADFGRRTEWMTDHQEEIVLRVSQLGLFAFMGMVLMGVWGVNLGGLLVGAGFLGIVVGLAARQTLGSLIAGFVLMFSRPFTIGDWVQVGDQEGIVTDITIFNTRLENFDGEFVVLPNDKVSDSAVVNRSQKGLLRLRVDVGVDYGTDIDEARQVALEAISECKEVIDAPPPQVFPKAFGDSAVVLELRFWIDHPTPPRKWKAVSAVIGAVKSDFEAAGIKIPFPQRELSGRAETGGFRVHDAATGEPSDAPEPAPEPRESD